jgi:integrase
MKLTKAAVEKLEATGKRYNQFDSELKGFCVRMGVSGHKVFYFVYRAGKGRGTALKWLRLGAFPSISVEQARAMARKMAASVALGEDPARKLKEDKAAPLLKEAIETFFAEHVVAKCRQSTGKLYGGLIRNKIVPWLGAFRVADVEHRHIAMLHHAMRNTPYMANRCCAVLSKFFTWSEKNGYRQRGTNPASGVEKFKEHKRTAFMSAEELSCLGAALAELEQAWNDRKAMRQRREKAPARMAVLTPQAANVIRLLCLTGARLGEILSLKWEYLDLSMGLARLPDSKTGAKVLHLPRPAVEVLSGMPGHSEWVFPRSKGNGHRLEIHHAWRTLCKKAGLTGWRVHDLRHCFASVAVNSGHSLPQIGALLGHTQVMTTARYSHVAANPVHAVAEDTGAKIAKAMKTPPKRARGTPPKRTGNE